MKWHVHVLDIRIKRHKCGNSDVCLQNSLSKNTYSKIKIVLSPLSKKNSNIGTSMKQNTRPCAIHVQSNLQGRVK